MTDKISKEQFVMIFSELWYAYSDKPMNEMQAMVYYKHLGVYPADRIVIVINAWIDNERWFPHINEIIEEMRYSKKPYNAKQIEGNETILEGQAMKDILKNMRNNL